MCNRLKTFHGDFCNCSGKRQRKSLLDNLPLAYHQPLPIIVPRPSVYPVILSTTGSKENNASTTPFLTGPGLGYPRNTV